MPDDQQPEAKPAGEGEYEPPTVTPIGSIDQLTAVADEVTSIDDNTGTVGA